MAGFPPRRITSFTTISTVGVFPVPPHVMFPTLITRQGSFRAFRLDHLRFQSAALPYNQEAGTKQLERAAPRRPRPSGGQEGRRLTRFPAARWPSRFARSGGFEMGYPPRSGISILRAGCSRLSRKEAAHRREPSTSPAG